MSKLFLEAQSRLKTLKNEPDNDSKLKLYGLFKQVNSAILTCLFNLKYQLKNSHRQLSVIVMLANLE